jgi:hypothetical protein
MRADSPTPDTIAKEAMERLSKSEHFLISVPIGTPFAECIAGWPEGRCCGFPGRPNLWDCNRPL